MSTFPAPAIVCLLYRYRRHGHKGLGLDYQQYYLAVVEAVGNVLHGHAPFLYLVWELKLIVYRNADYLEESKD